MSECPSTRKKCDLVGGKLQFINKALMQSQAVAGAYFQMNVNAKIAAFAVATCTQLAELQETISTTISGAQTVGR